MDNQNIFIAVDGDGIGSKVARAVLSDDVAAVKDVSARIQAGQDVWASWSESYSGQVISHGGDESSYELPSEALDTLEQARKDYEYATGGMSCTAGVGSKPSEAAKSLIVGKLRGKNNITTYDQSVEQEYQQASLDTENGTATGEAAKLGHAYMEKDPKMKNDSSAKPADQKNAPAPESDDHADCPYCQELGAQGDSDPDHCESCHDEGDDCPYCNDSEDEDHDPSSPDHTDDCPYCQEPTDEPVETSESSDPKDGEQMEDGEDKPSITDDPSEHTQEGMAQILDQIVNEDGEGNSIEGSDDEDIDDAAEPVTSDMQGNVSRPDGYDSSTPGDMGLDAQNSPHAESNQGGQEPAPDFGSVLQGGLEDHADSIQKERVTSMVFDALQNFKANKASLDQAKDAVPGLYQSSIQMLQAMIEMAKLLGLEKSPEGDSPQAPQLPQAGNSGTPAAPAAAPGVAPTPKLLG